MSFQEDVVSKAQGSFRRDHNEELVLGANSRISAEVIDNWTEDHFSYLLGIYV